MDLDKDGIPMLDHVVCLEYGYARSVECQNDIFLKWRSATRWLDRLRGGTPHDLGNFDAHMDCMIREVEANQHRVLQETGNASEHGRTTFQIQMSRYWIMSMYETLRTVRGINKGKTGADIDLVNKWTIEFGGYRMPIAKQEVQQIKKITDISIITVVDGNLVEVPSLYPGLGQYRPRMIMDKDNGSVCFASFNANTNVIDKKSRLDLSNEFLSDLAPFIAEKI